MPVRLRSAAWAALAVGLSFALWVPLTGCHLLFQLDEIEPLEDTDGLDNGYTCRCTCTYPDGMGPATVALQVCVPPALNPNLVNGTTPSPTQLANDCGAQAGSRVRTQLQRMTNQCSVRNPSCTCEVDDPVDTFFDATCDKACVAVPVAEDCSNWDLPAGIKEATCGGTALCSDPGPVCLTQQVDPPVPAPAALAEGILGRASECVIDAGLSHVDVSASGAGDETSPLTGVMHFAPTSSPSCSADEDCAVMSYRVEPTQQLEFDGVLGFNTHFRDIITVGSSAPFALEATGDGIIPPQSTQTSGRATQIDTRPIWPDGTSRQALFGTNSDVLDVFFKPPFCRVRGSLVGAVTEDDDEASFAVTIDASGIVQNTPPQASIATDETVECTSPDGAEVTLDATATSDFENNIVAYGWVRGNPGGDDLGPDPVVVVDQAIGDETYFLNVIDAFMQSDRASATVTVGDTTGPAIECNAPSTITPRLTPYEFTATATDVCDPALGAPEVVGYDCFALTKKGKAVVRACQVGFSGDTFTIFDSGGVGDHFRWRVSAADVAGNATITTCETEVVKPGPGPPPP